MNGGVTAPANALLQKHGVINLADVNVAGGHGGALHLCVAAQTKICVGLNEQHPVDGTVRIVAGHAAFAHRFMLKNERSRLLAMTLRARFILPRHEQSARRFENVIAVRVVALHAIHVAFDDRMMRRQFKFRVNFQMAAKTGFGIFVRIDDELTLAAGFDVAAAGAVTGFAAGFRRHLRVGKRDARVRAGVEFARDVRMTIRADAIADVMRAGNFQRLNRHH